MVFREPRDEPFPEAYAELEHFVRLSVGNCSDLIVDVPVSLAATAIEESNVTCRQRQRELQALDRTHVLVLSLA
jgi:hypothetical protein